MFSTKGWESHSLSPGLPAVTPWVRSRPLALPTATSNRRAADGSARALRANKETEQSARATDMISAFPRG
ncbi:hypothetical protein VTO42DRAFT_176 [Malbranchea cinnamomea]